jgi:hypothetical protein
MRAAHRQKLLSRSDVIGGVRNQLRFGQGALATILSIYSCERDAAVGGVSHSNVPPLQPATQLPILAARLRRC